MMAGRRFRAESMMPTTTSRVAHARVRPAPGFVSGVFVAASAPRWVGDIAVRVSTVRISSLAIRPIIES
ncbi:hypothetical protein GCM10010360_70620 [Streptomyces nogalater]